MTLDELKERLEAFVLSQIDDAFELVELRVKGHENARMIEILADKKEGKITIEECALLNKRLSQAIEDGNILDGDYSFEVSSPGLDRSLKTRRDFERVLGKDVRFHLLELIEGKLEHSGEIIEVTDNGVVVGIKAGKIILPLNKINKAVLIL